MYSIFNTFNMQIYGASHADKIGVKINNFPKNQEIDLEKLQAFVNRRKGTNSPWSTPRIEEDKVIFEKGINGNKTEAEIDAYIENNNQKSSDYSPYEKTPRPSHSDYVAIIKDKEKVDLRGGGRFSGRMTAPICIAGGIAIQILEKYGIEIAAYTKKIGSVESMGYDDKEITINECKNLKAPFAITHNDEMIEEVLKAKEKGDSVGGQIECIIFNMIPGVGNNLFEGLEGRLAAALFGVPAVKAVEFGKGTKLAQMNGSEANDPFVMAGEKVITKTNNNGGINGGISNGMPITMRVTIKPTPSISKEQDTVNLETKENTKIVIKGRHDACIVPRAIPVVESCCALVILDALVEEGFIK